MNKKLFLGMFAAASMLFATSCSNDELEVVQSGDEAQVSFKLGLEDVIGSRAISDGKTADKLVYAVFDNAGNRISTIGQVSKETSFPTTVSLTLAKGQSYQVAFWAQNKACTAYTVGDNMEVTVNYEGVNNDETRDAFFKTVGFTVTGSTSIDVELKRPFAQVNVGVTEADWNAAVASGVTIANSSVLIKKAATVLEVVTGKVRGSTDVSYTLNAIPEDELKVDADKDGTKETYKWLSMSYILPADETTGYDKTTLENIAFVFDPANGNDIEFKQGLNAVPVQRNWRTNILGKILTGDIQFNITIDPVYDGDINYPDGSAQELELAAKMGGAVTLTEDVVLTEPLIVAADMVLNMNGKIITGALKVAEGISLTIENGKIQPMVSEYVNGITSNGNLTLNNVEVTSTRHAVRIESGSAVINGGIYKVDPKSNSTLHALHVGDDGTVANVIVKGGTFIGPKGTKADSGSAVNVKNGSTVTIEGGDFSGGKNKTLAASGNLTVTGGTFDQNPTTWVAAGFKSIEKNRTWYVVANDVTDVASTQEELDAAIVANSTILLGAGNYEFPKISVEGVTVICEEGTVFTGCSSLNINGATVIGATFSNPSGNASEGTINGTFKKCTFSGSNASRWAYANNSDIVFEDCVFNANGVYAIHYDGTTDANILYKNCKITGWVAIAGGHKSLTFDGCQIYGNGTYGLIRVYGDTTIKNCTFDVAKVNTSDKYQDGIHAVDCTITVENCVNVNGEIGDIFNVSGTGVINKK